MNSLLLFVTFLAIGYSQQRTCEFRATVPNSKEPYLLNLTQISTWILEQEQPDHFYYYSPCRNGLQCQQGTANFYSNTAQYKQGANQCVHYLSVDHHEDAAYSFHVNAWRFSYADGQLCDITQQPRTMNIYYHCNDINNNSPAQIEAVQEPSPCNYDITIKSTLACVPENEYNKNCQWKEQVPGLQSWKFLDLSELKGRVIHAPWGNGYDYHYSVCANGIHCWQQNAANVMAGVDNRATGTCDHNLGVWENGNVHPFIQTNTNPFHWSFHYFNGDKCTDGRQGEFRVRWFCDARVDDYKILDEGMQGDCDFFLNLSSKHACMDQEPKWIPAKAAFA